MDDEGRLKSGQAYQVIGHLASGSANVSEAEWRRALDYFSDSERVDEEFLPWPR